MSMYTYILVHVYVTNVLFLTSVSFATSYTPKNMLPPKLIHNTRGTTPENNLIHPSSLRILANVWLIVGDSPCFVDNMMRVFMTSNGVVHAAATPPAMDPQSATCHGFGERCQYDFHDAFSHSYRGNWMQVNGI